MKPHSDVEEPGYVEPASGSKRSKGCPTDVQEHAPSYRQSPQYWYPDGSVIVIAGSMGFKLYRARLNIYCGYFAERARTGEDLVVGACEHGDSEEEDSSRVEEHTTTSCANAPGLTQVRIDDLSSTDFTRFLDVLETPQLEPKPLPDSHIAASLLRAATRLDCQIVRTKATRAILAAWPDGLPRPSAPLRPFQDAIDAITLARACGMPEVRRPAFYALLRDPAFWTALAADRRAIALPEDDLLRLHEARHTLQITWRVFVLKMPGEGRADLGSVCKKIDVPMGGPPRTCQSAAKDARACWRSLIIDSDMWEKGAVDPICCMLDEKNVRGLEYVWCSECMRSARYKWFMTRRRWWDMLNRLFGLPD
ncbi:hypothetical protein TRAPUB_1307 [Trametes pubescens]|uniref:BTB domain-containing protein n=1 Tax=Trametes pubescens TaxID=154538 RepID=A0A1M2VJS0_TRAPU|nr:hypothetical protein TRAPUB_1307 [Trametes pubescens]